MPETQLLASPPAAQSRATARDRRRAGRRGGPFRWSLRRWHGMAIAVVALLSVGAIATGGLALHHEATARAKVVDRVEPGVAEALVLTTALLNQESGVRGYVLTRRPELLEPYRQGRDRESASVATLRRLVGELPRVGSEIDTVTRRAAAWRAGYAEPAIAAVGAGGVPAGDVTSEERFYEVRAALEDLRGSLAAAQRSARGELQEASSLLRNIGIVIVGCLLVVAVVLAEALRRAAITPLSRLAVEARRVADGEFDHEMEVTGPREVVELAGAVDSMRWRILHELAELDARTHDLQRSNAELEQFAYVASHDLQEPLRKVAGFCELLARRYRGQLDERAEQYIGFAVDGATRMQALINDLLAFSRLGRVPRDRVPIDANALLQQAKVNLAAVIEETGAQITSDELPVVSAEAALLTTVFQNLLGNALKFHGQTPPRVHIGVHRHGADWVFSCADHGIGIGPEYAERIFVIFQRLHVKEEYEGTGIGLAMCRKIIEYHGGRIWLDTSDTEATTFRFTLPATEGDDTHE